MKILIASMSFAALFYTASVARAQQSPPLQPTAQSEAGEPRASTSPAPADRSPPAAKTPKSSAQSEAGEPRAGEPRAGEPRAAVSAVGRPGKPGAAVAGDGASPVKPKAPGGSDRLELGMATVTGDREQPKVMYIVPWKRSDIGDLAGKPMNSLVDEILSPVDRDVFKREVVYYKAVQADASQNGAPGHRSDQGER